MMNVLPFAGRIQDQSKSLFRKMPFSALQEFKWAACVTELEDKCPFLYRLFTTIVSHSDHHNTNKCGSNHIPGVCMCIAVLLKERNREMSGIQTYISLALFNRVQKKVCYTKRALTKLILIFWSACVHCITYVHMHVHVHVGLHSASSACTMCTCTCRLTLICTIYICTCICRFTLV